MNYMNSHGLDNSTRDESGEASSHENLLALVIHVGSFPWGGSPSGAFGRRTISTPDLGMLRTRNLPPILPLDDQGDKRHGRERRDGES